MKYVEQTKSIKELRELHAYPYSIDVIQWWLMKYGDLRKASEIDRACICGTCSNICSCFKDPCECYAYLPPYCGLHSDKNNAYTSFREIFDKLDELIDAHKDEKYFENELIEYEIIKDNPTRLKEWVKKNEYLGTEKHFMFQINHLDYMGDVHHVQLYTSPDENLDIYLDIKDFKHLNNFLDIFSNLFWNEKILPESLKKMAKKNKKFAHEHGQ
jgi:hypothetical protein